MARANILTGLGAEGAAEEAAGGSWAVLEGWLS